MEELVRVVFPLLHRNCLIELLVTPVKMINNWPSFSFKIYINVAFNCAVRSKSFAFHLLSNN
jgi:hypothetical protein